MNRELNRMRKRTQENINHAKTILNQSALAVDDHLGQIQEEYHRVVDLSRNAPAIIENIDKAFREKTKLTDTDIVFLMICTALQCVRQYLLTNNKLRLQDLGSMTSSKRGDAMMHSVYNASVGAVAPPSWEAVLFQGTVPYDVTRTGIHVSDTGLSGTTHRYRTLGHDPVLGWIFGPANIMTSSLTKTDFLTTYQVSNNFIIRRFPGGTLGMLEQAARTAKKDPVLLTAAVARQAIHFGSDYFTKQGLPIPLIATVNNDLAKTMITKCNIDLWSVTRGATLAALINQLIAVIHRLFYSGSRDGDETMYEVRTRKILSYSNALAVGSNVVVAAVTEDLTKLDAGGILVALHRFISDYQFIQNVKRDFLKNEIYNQIVGKPYDFMEVM